MASISERARSVVSAPVGFKVKKSVTHEQLKIIEGQPYTLRFDGPITEAPADTARRKRRGDDERPARDGRKMAPPLLALVTDYTTDPTGLPRQIVVGSVLDTKLCENYPEDSYVGRYFLITKHRTQGKDYATYEIIELETEGGEIEVSDGRDHKRGRK